MRLQFAAAAVLIAVSLDAQTTVIDQGRSALDKNDAQAAVALLQSAIAQSPRSADAHYLLGVAYGVLAQKANVFRQPALARHTRDEFERAVSLDPNHLDARFALVQYYTLAPGWLGGNRQRALQQANEIRRRSAPMGDQAAAFVERSK